MTQSSLAHTPSSGAGRSPDQLRVVRKRNRVPLSCYSCRSKKKCDRSHPCSNCVKREGADTLSCSYASPANRKKNQAEASNSPDDMQNRIDRLEGLVLSLMHGGANISPSDAAAAAAVATSSGSSKSGAGAATTATPTSSSARMEEDGPIGDDDYDGEEDSDIDDGLANSLGVLKVDADRGKSMYIGQEHWHTILADISEVKNYFINHKKDLEKSYERVLLSKPETARDGPTFLMGATPATDIELRAELPPKSHVLALCGRYFNSMDNAVNIVHAPTFHQLLRRHWQDPSKTPLMWLGLLYSVLCLAMLSYHKVGDEPQEWRGRTLQLAAEYRLRTVQCLIAADYTKPGEYTVETMLLYIFGEFSSRWDADMSLYLINSIVTRVAFRMGYHRDAKWFPSLTPFQAEMRRRTWALLRMSDVVFSHQVSLPTMIYEHDCDTSLPNNIFDEEFGPDTKVLPPSRPDSEPTPISYMIAKVKLCCELGNILQATCRVAKQVPYDEILRFDAKLRELREELPPHLKMQPLEGANDPLTLIVARFNVDILYLKIMCLLHRKYLTRSRHNPRYAHSRRSAIEAALEMLSHLNVLHRESQPNGRLQSIKWYVASIATKEFLMPSMLVLLDLHFDKQAERSDRRQDSQSLFFWTPEQRMDMMRSLESARDIWSGLQDGSMEAVKAYNIVKIMLDKINGPPQLNAGNGVASPVPPSNLHIKNDIFADLNDADMQPEHSAAMTLGMMSSGGLTPNTAAILGNTVQSPGGTAYPAMDFSIPPPGEATGMTPDFSGDLALNPGSPFSSMFNVIGNGMDVSQNFDWVTNSILQDALQNYTENTTWGADGQFQTFLTGDMPAAQPSTDPSPGSGESYSFSTPGSSTK
ncbi:fungal-specific transcription factor domain-containing protein [Coniella lustricola]|uniref:Fungal-specific transcription factor domain-containing protein n=1 Tax=Coniella lustricola TaxID=2025994 RepID=A0A2T3AMH8_9PEZI|nr:fungal-specific transcription factor domain-containing protein [Coniella lustricola]